MLNDIKLSTVLLLAIVGFFIYCVMKPSEGFANSETVTEKAQESTGTYADADVSHDLVSEVLAESEPRMGVAAPNVVGGSVADFQANDEDVGVGAALDTAFDKPIPEGTKTDVVDLNKNNVKNYDAKDYLPKEVNDDWFNTDFSQAKYKMNDDKLINTERYVVGINTVGQSLKNGSYDIRGAINVPKYSVSPWNNSTVEPDYNIKPLC